MTLTEAKNLRSGQTIKMRVTNPKNKRFGEMVNVKVNGQPKTWKRSPERVQVPIKYGLYEYGYITEDTLDNFSVA